MHHEARHHQRSDAQLIVFSEAAQDRGTVIDVCSDDALGVRFVEHMHVRDCQDGAPELQEPFEIVFFL